MMKIKKIKIKQSWIDEINKLADRLGIERTDAKEGDVLEVGLK